MIIPAAAVAFGCLLAARGGAPVRTIAPADAPESILLTAAPQPEGLYLTWSGSPGAHYTVRWKAATADAWLAADVGANRYYSVGPLPNDRPVRVQVEARGEGAPAAVSPIVEATPRLRPGCTTLDYIPGPPRISFFCTKAALDTYLQRQAIDPMTLRCRQQPVTTWTNAPDCLYTTPGGEQLLLLRSADDRFVHAGGYPEPADVRRAARQAIWGAGDPFRGRSPRPDMRPIPPVTGRVTKFARARSYELRFRTLSSRFTWFVPGSPVDRRFAIYHEGHGGSGTDIGADTIDWLLERGWQVVALDMPLIGVNAVDAREGLTSHADFERLDDGVVSPVAHFVLPVKAVVDWLTGRGDQSDRELLLIGRSGGGLTTYLYAALDPRIDIAVPVAGGRPNSARLDAPWGAAELGDYEQTAPHLYGAASHESLMAAAGSRGAFFVFNRWDSCCYRVQPGDPFVAYLTAAGRSTGRTIGVYVDEENPGHSIGPKAYLALDDYLRRLVGPRPAPSPAP